MKSIDKSQSQVDVIQRLNSLLPPATELYPSKVWSFLSTPKKSHSFTQGAGIKKRNFTQTFTQQEYDDLLKIKDNLITYILTKNKYRCCYCKRSIGKHGWSWEIEHIKNKKQYPQLTFELSNLTLACIDCNRFKNINIDNKDRSQKIIDPNQKNFDYESHIKFFQLSTAKLHLLKYTPISSEGNTTYNGLCFEKLEYQEVLKSIDEIKCDSINKIDAAIEYFNSNEENKPIANFLLKLKSRILK
ncbi:HNH endonuclease [Vibrio cholerae]